MRSGSSHSNQALHPGQKLRLIEGGESQVSDLESQISRLTYERERISKDISEMEREASMVQSELSRIELQVQGFEREERNLKARLILLINERSDIASLSVQTCQDEKLKSQESLEFLKTQFVALQSQKEEAIQALEVLEESLQENLRKQDAIKEESDAVLEKLHQATTFKTLSEKEVSVLRSRKDYEESEVSLLLKKSTDLQSSIASMIVESSRISERIQVTASKASLEKDLSRTQLLLEELTRTQPDPAAIGQELACAREALEKSRSLITAEERLMNRLKITVENRETLWAKWRKLIAKQSNIEFILMLSARGFEGSLGYDFDESQLTIKVKPRAQIASDAIKANDMLTSDTDASSITAERDVRQLSGGEKSYSTACFLFSLWSSMSAPLRCLDEFDVFMDQVNRDYIIDQLVISARTSNVQFMLITPNAIQYMSPMFSSPYYKICD